MKCTKWWKRICTFMLTAFGVPVMFPQAQRHPYINTISVEGFELQDTDICVYGGPSNHIRSSVYGKVSDARSHAFLSGIKIEVYDGTHQRCCVYTEEDGSFSIDSLSVWAGVGMSYAMIVSDPNGAYKAAKRVLSFDVGEASKEVLVALEPND